jgi:hypothetical protein
MPKLVESEKSVSVATNANSLCKLSETENKAQHCTQNVNVNIKIDQQEDGLTRCFKAIAGIFKRKK